MLLIMLVQSLLLGGALIVLPIGSPGSRPAALDRRRSAFMAYFLGLGLGFLMIEISFVQKYVLVLGYPTYSLSVTVCSLLVSAAIGGRPQPPRLEPSQTVLVRAAGRHRRAHCAGTGSCAGLARATLGGLPTRSALP